MAKPKTHISYLLDETGSMLRQYRETVDGFNEYIQTLQAEKGAKKNRFTLTKFNSCRVQVAHDAVPLSEVQPLTTDNYKPECTTPLLDAVGRTIRAMEASEKHYDRLLMVIMTDGVENASKEYDHVAIRKLIEQKQSQGNWTFVYQGANQDSWANASRLGFDPGNVSDYDQSQAGVAMKNMTDASVGYLRSSRRRSSRFWDGGK